MAQDTSSPKAGSSALQVIVYWAIVAVPLSWGVYKTVQKSIPLFNGASTVATAPSTPTPLSKDTAATPVPSAVSTPVPAAVSSPAPMIAPPLEASPFSTAQPSATVAPIETPAPPTT